MEAASSSMPSDALVLRTLPFQGASLFRGMVMVSDMWISFVCFEPRLIAVSMPDESGGVQAGAEPASRLKERGRRPRKPKAEGFSP
jgi:hypothetical protein